MTVDEATLLAWLDGELSPDAAAAVAAAVAADPDLQALATAHRALADRLRAGLAPVLAEPVPDRIARLVAPETAVTEPAATVTDLAAVRAARAAATPPAAGLRRWLPQGAAMAASLVIGLLVGRAGLDQAPQGLVVATPAGLQASGALASALDTRLAAEPGGGVRMGVSFRDRDGRICRSWQALREEGIACRAGDGWAVTAALARPPEDGGGYRMAGSAGLGALLDGMMAGEPFDAAQERAARDRGWR